MSTNWESLSKHQKRLAYITVIMEAVEKFENLKNNRGVPSTELPDIDSYLEKIHKVCVEFSEFYNLKLSVPFPETES